MKIDPLTLLVQRMVTLASSDEQELDRADKEAEDAFEKSKKDAKEAKVYTCPGPRMNGGVFIDPRPETQKQRDKRWEQVKKG